MVDLMTLLKKKSNFEVIIKKINAHHTNTAVSSDDITFCNYFFPPTMAVYYNRIQSFMVFLQCDNSHANFNSNICIMSLLYSCPPLMQYARWSCLVQLGLLLSTNYPKNLWIQTLLRYAFLFVGFIF